MRRDAMRVWYRKALGYPFLAFVAIPLVRKAAIGLAKFKTKGAVAPVIDDLLAEGEKHGIAVRPHLAPSRLIVPPSAAHPKQVERFVWNSRKITKHYFTATNNGSVETGKDALGRLFGCDDLRFPATFTAVVPNAVLDFETGFARTEGGLILRESNVRRLIEEVKVRLAIPPAKDVRRLEGEYVSFLFPWTSNYAHWITDFLPRAALAMKHGFAGTYLLREGSPGFVKASLLAMGIPEEKLVAVADDQLIVEKLWIPAAADRLITPRPEYLHDIVARTRKTAGCENVKPTRRVFISRRSAERAIVNEDELIPIMEARGFEIVQTEKLTFLEQVELFSSAEIMMGCHGAGMYNAMFMQPGTLAIEIYNLVRWELSVVTLCRTMSVDHWNIHAENRNYVNWLTYMNPREFTESLDMAIEYLEERKGL